MSMTKPNASQVIFNPAGVGAAATTVQAKLWEVVSLKDYGSAEDGVTDDSQAMVKAIASLPNGGDILISDTPLIGGVVVNTEGIRFVGKSPKRSKIIVKNSSTGITVRQNFVDFENLTIKSQGTKGDGLGTNGVLYEKTPVNSIGLAEHLNVNWEGFSGFGCKVVNAINFVRKKGYVLSNQYGVVYDRDSGGTSFGTTVSEDDVYYSSNDIGVVGNFLYQSRFNIIAEFNTYGMFMTVGSFTLLRSYFESNINQGCFAQDCDVQDLFSYSNGAGDPVSITFTGAVAASDRGYVRQTKNTLTAKKLALLTNYGLDPKEFAAYGDSTNIGLTYGANVVPLIRGDNLLIPSAWASNTSNEFQGWSNSYQGYKVAGSVNGGNPYGMTQDVTLSTSNQYVVDLSTITVSGSGLLNVKAGSLSVTPGVPFTPASSGSQAIKTYGVDSNGTVFECYVTAFSLSVVGTQTKYTALAQQKLSASQQGRGPVYSSAAPTSGTWALGEIVYNSAPASAGYVGWVCTAAGTPGTWKGFGAIAA